MKGSLLKAMLAVVAVCLIPTIASAQTVSVDYDRTADFSKFRTYAWREGRPAANPLIDKRIVEAVDRQLAARGWIRTDSSPSAIVMYAAGLDAERQLKAWGSGPRWNGFGTVTAQTIYTGQLMLDIYEAATRQLVWRGVASDTVRENTEKNDKRLYQAIAKLFRQLPSNRMAIGTR
jgi:hypothetical protein